MSRKYKFYNPDGVYFVTLTVVKWIDIFTRDEYREIVLDSLRYCQKRKGLVIHAFVIMTNHLHMVISQGGNVQLENIFRDFKKYTTYRLLKAIKDHSAESRKDWILRLFKEAGDKSAYNNRYQFWQNGNHPIELISNKMIDQRLLYLHENPVVQGFVNSAEDYPWSSIHNYTGERGLIEVEIID